MITPALAGARVPDGHRRPGHVRLWQGVDGGLAFARIGGRCGGASEEARRAREGKGRKGGARQDESYGTALP